MEQTSLVARNVTIKKASQIILDDLSFIIPSGKITGLIGPSGSGKTTLMRSIVGVQAITEGSLKVFNQPAGDVSLRSRIGYVTQSPAVYADLTVGQNLNYFAKLVKADASQVKTIIQTVRLDDKKQQLVEKSSGGEKTLVSLAVALLGNPDMIVMDEPTVGLDPILRQELWHLFKELAGQGKTLLVSSHVMDEADRCDQLLLMRGGKLLWSDSKNKLLKTTHTDSVEAAFIQTISAHRRINNVSP